MWNYSQEVARRTKTPHNFIFEDIRLQLQKAGTNIIEQTEKCQDQCVLEDFNVLDKRETFPSDMICVMNSMFPCD